MADRLPAYLAALAPDRDRVSRLLAELEGAGDSAAQADLAGELVHFASRYQDTKDRALYPRLERVAPGHQELARARADHEAVRDALAAVRARTRHVVPRNARVADPDGFDAELGELVDRLRSHPRHEDASRWPLVESLDASTAQERSDALSDAEAHAVAHPRPPRHRLARAVVGLGERLDRRVEDASTPGHQAPTYEEPG